MALIEIEGMEFFAKHGYYKEENVVGRCFVVDVRLEVNNLENTFQNSLETTVNYEKIYKIVAQQMQHTEKFLEKVAQNIIKEIKVYLKILPVHITVKIAKINPPVGGVVKKCSVTFSG